MSLKWDDEMVKRMLGAFQEDGDHYSGACSIQVLHGGGGCGVATQYASARDINHLLVLGSFQRR